MSDTPRTDAASETGRFDIVAVVSRQLERELAEQNAAAIVARQGWDGAERELAALRAEQVAPNAVAVPGVLLENANDIYDLMLRCSKSCRPMEHLLTTDGLYNLNTADLHVRSDGKNYVMEADWAKLCGKLVKAMKEIHDGKEPYLGGHAQAGHASGLQGAFGGAGLEGTAGMEAQAQVAQALGSGVTASETVNLERTGPHSKP